MKKQDRRIARTRKALIGAVIELGLERGFESVKVKDITDRADVGNSTFYRHYKSKDDLLGSHLSEIQQEISRGMYPEMTHYELSLLVFTVIGTHRDACLLAMRLPDDHPVIKPILKRATQTVNARYKARDETIIPLEVSANHLVNSFVKLFHWWITEGQAYSCEQMATIANELILKVTESAALDEREASPPPDPDLPQ
ncbi:MAG: TetR/AcrR family transcriptional regulator [Chloroflexi bacterium]|nr:TetR/AcrR family transcriptional regulator [Chloroflexota bacterium]